MPEQTPTPNEAIVAQLRADFEALLPFMQPALEPAVTYELPAGEKGE